MFDKRVLGIDYVTLKGREGRDTTNGATADEDNYTHLGSLFDRQTACKLPIKNFFATYSDVDIDCPACIKVIKEPA